ncbi:MAG TPA: sigma-70 family RNA polymerase sigma factor [Solirubrobacteraceae bacterium]|nr:sigma-70 family RNA polymerase sigma factor [Solirubrobacteraceae bacterium]
MTSATAAAATAAAATTTTSASRRWHDATIKPTDSTLITRVADGDGAAFEELYRRHERRVLMLARKLCASRELAEEVAQEAFISLWRGAHAYRPESGSVSAWLSSMVRNRAIDAWRRSAVRPVEVEMSEGGGDQLRAPTGAEPAAPERALALSLIADLPAAQKQAVFLAYFGDMTHSEIATYAGSPLGTVKGRIRLGLERLRPGLDPVRDDAAAARRAPAPQAAA